jgi:hypothetical protein
MRLDRWADLYLEARIEGIEYYQQAEATQADATVVYWTVCIW